MKSVALAATSIRAGEADIIVAGGIESMSRFPFMLGGAQEPDCDSDTPR